jgi:hypothetical protein
MYICVTLGFSVAALLGVVADMLESVTLVAFEDDAARLEIFVPDFNFGLEAISFELTPLSFLWGGGGVSIFATTRLNVTFAGHR